MDHHAGVKLSELIFRLVGKVEYYSTDESIPPNLAVHELRKSFKRLRSLLRFYRNLGAAPGRKISRKIRNFGRKLSLLRESWVNMDLFESSMAGIETIPGKKLRKAGKLLKLKNQELVTEEFQRGDIRGSIRKYISGMESRLEESAAGNISLGDIIAEISRNNRGCYKRFQKLPTDYPSRKLHALRKQMKRLYYQLDFLWQLQPGSFRERTEQLDLINDQLGADHDYYILLEELGSPEYGFDNEEMIILGNHLSQLREENLLALRHRLKEFFAKSPDEFDLELERLFI